VLVWGGAWGEDGTAGDLQCGRALCSECAHGREGSSVPLLIAPLV
jgi:hypothetical protein